LSRFLSGLVNCFQKAKLSLKTFFIITGMIRDSFSIACVLAVQNVLATLVATRKNKIGLLANKMNHLNLVGLPARMGRVAFSLPPRFRPCFMFLK
jgi:hypothetical protein